MNTDFDTTGLHDHPDYWDALAARIAAAAARNSKASSLDWLASSRASWITVSLLLLAAWASWTIGAASPSAEGSRTEWTQALAPADGVGKAIAASDRPPAIGALLIGNQRGDAR